MRSVSTGYAPHGFIHRLSVEILQDPYAGIRMGVLFPVTEKQVWAAKLNCRVTAGIERLQIKMAVSSPLGVSSIVL
jgi:hypothetical protein